ncbi:HlyD family type I secretion periplasmic adaptor subunit [Pseudomonas fragi]|jgi:membrane fusion protein, protease secretion system|uniref:Membrane fusion protein (MFP) family protein n=2 Tax=Pseudomonas fragi TaxID=296 RepID=A0A9Q5B0R9_PSEFR|nr:HlyD family type I secretion periplasmic adaptor subunit [Pseudomonas fragi]MBM1200778.1 HlyD family type I secretion periplasmic adaptor subunit [Pseudomonas fragi]NNB08213.1 HlyD family type I secretion periplasmic adaptor subunit [Pseudomonas fragi]NNB24941.1 HlyD family type I secretion periplasmic adaptor subunit [Pseudomonas fragi]NNB34943.1 HlyD family type I secretion periplasmic adaptor subunit [Pseudomonas fragi]NNB48631.1 HlyD family type I secretion periplasmic adaptor subunit [
MTQLNAKAVGDSNVLQLDDTRYSRLGWLLMLGGFLGFLGWAALAPLDKGVAVSGKVMVSGHRKVVQHPSGGIVERIDVRDGDKVAAGQVLIRLKETPLLGQAQSLRSQFYGSLASEARLNAERDGVASVSFPVELTALAAEPEVASNLALQRQLFDSRRQALLLDQQGIDESIAGAEAQLRGVRDSQASKVLQRTALTEQLQGLRELAREGYIPRNRLLDSERVYAQVLGSISEDYGRIGQLQRQVLEMRLKIRQLAEEYQKEVRTQLADTRVRTEDLRNRLASAEFELANSQLRAPVAGIVVGLDVFTEGGVIKPGQALMEIVPQGEPLLVEARVPVELADKVHAGLPVELMFSAFSQSTTPRVAGEVTLVSADRQVDERTDEPYYTLRAQVSEAGMAQLAGLQIRPGMPVEAFVRTGERSMLNYLFKPLLDRTHMALVEE